MHRKGQLYLAVGFRALLSHSQCFASAARSMTYQFHCHSGTAAAQPCQQEAVHRAHCISVLTSVAFAVTGHNPAFAHDRSSLDGVWLNLSVSSGLGDSDRVR